MKPTPSGTIGRLWEPWSIFPIGPDGRRTRSRAMPGGGRTLPPGRGHLRSTSPEGTPPTRCLRPRCRYPRRCRGSDSDGTAAGPFTAGGGRAFGGARSDSRVDQAGRPGFKPVAPEFRSDRARKQAIHSMEHRQWHWRTPTVVIVVLVVFGALAFVGSRRSNHHATAKTSITTVAGQHPTPVHHGSTTPTTSPKPTKPTPTTTTKPPTQLVATSSTAALATYSVSSTSYDVTITADGTCWVDATNVSSGSTV